MPSPSIPTTTESRMDVINVARQWLNHIEVCIAGAGDIANVDPRFLLQLPASAPFADFVATIDSVTKIIQDNGELEVKASAGSTRSAQTTDVLMALEVLRASYPSEADWAPLMQTQRQTESVIDKINRLVPYRMERPDRHFDPVFDNALFALNMSLSGDELNDLIATGRLKAEIDLRRTAMVDDLNEILDSLGPNPSPLRKNVEDTLKFVEDAASFASKSYRSVLTNVRDLEDFQKFIGSADFQNLEVTGGKGLFSALSVLGLQLHNGTRLVNVPDIVAAYEKKLLQFEDLSFLPLDSDPSIANKQNSARNLAMQRFTAAKEALIGTGASANSRLADYITNEREYINERAAEYQKWLDNARTPGEFNAYVAFGVERSPFAVRVDRVVSEYRAIKRFFENENVRTLLGAATADARLSEFEGHYNNTIEFDVLTQKNKLNQRYIADQNDLRQRRVANLVVIKRQEEANRFSSQFDGVRKIDDPKWLSQYGRQMTKIVAVASVALIPILLFGNSLSGLIADPFVGLIVLAGLPALASAALTMRAPDWLADLAVRRYMETMQRFLGNKIRELEVQIKEPKEFPPVFEEWAISQFLFKRKYEDEHRDLILKTYFELKPLFEQVPKRDEQTPGDNSRDIAQLKMKYVTLGMETKTLLQNGETGLTEDEKQTILGEDPTWFDQFRGTILDANRCEENYQRLRKYYYPDKYEAFFPNKQGYSLNEDDYKIFTASLKICRWGGTEHSAQDPHNKEALLNMMKSEAKEVFKLNGSYMDENNLEVLSLHMRLLMESTDGVDGLYSQRVFYSKLRELDAEVRK